MICAVVVLYQFMLKVEKTNIELMLNNFSDDFKINLGLFMV